jgi:hypothetical protein
MCRAKADWLRPDGIVDLKTTESAAPDALSKAAHNYGYAIQAPFYLRGFRLLADRTVMAIPVLRAHRRREEPPYLVHVNQLTERAMAWGDRQVSRGAADLPRLHGRRRLARLPDDEITDIDLPAWVRTEEY